MHFFSENCTGKTSFVLKFLLTYSVDSITWCFTFLMPFSDHGSPQTPCHNFQWKTVKAFHLYLLHDFEFRTVLSLYWCHPRLEIPILYCYSTLAWRRGNWRIHAFPWGIYIKLNATDKMEILTVWQFPFLYQYLKHFLLWCTQPTKKRIHK